MIVQKRISMIRKYILLALASALHLVAPASAQTKERNTNTSQTEKYRLVWFEDPTTTATFVWNQLAGDPATLYYGLQNQNRQKGKYSNRAKVNRVVKYDGMTNCFVRLQNLVPDSCYFMCLGDDFGVSRRFYFKTAPAKSEAFTFICGGDSRNFRDVRQAANTLCKKLAPLFVAFTGDMISQDNAEEWSHWLDDWQLTINEKGHLLPIAPHRGNHEARPESIPNHFGMPKDSYAAFSIGGDLFRYYILNSEIPADGAQGAWLSNDLRKNANGVTHLVAGYHKPMLPHTSGKALGRNPAKWAKTFYEAGLDLAMESDSHVMKRTLPIRPDASGKGGFRAAPDDPNATTYLGEGCWGAPLRKADVAFPWTVGAASFNGFDWIHVTPKAMYDKTVKVENVTRIEGIDPKKPYENPAGISLWAPRGGDEVLTIPAD
jgi:hypothetical protein|tara:strand:- start:197 stop:1492 length:1296 start_codon:yes stop_codon:yes gene_type:complete